MLDLGSVSLTALCQELAERLDRRVSSVSMTAAARATTGTQVPAQRQVGQNDLDELVASPGWGVLMSQEKKEADVVVAGALPAPAPAPAPVPEPEVKPAMAEQGERARDSSGPVGEAKVAQAAAEAKKKGMTEEEEWNAYFKELDASAPAAAASTAPCKESSGEIKVAQAAEAKQEAREEDPASGADHVDIWRDTPVRLLGYANEVGEAFRHNVPRA